MYIAREDLCLTQDGQRVVPASDPEAFTLLVAAGNELPDADATRYGLSHQNPDAVTATAVVAASSRGQRKRVKL